MKNLSILAATLIVTLLSACSSTPKVAIEKKSFVSDHYLMMSLLNRAVSQDQQMMLAFAEQRSSYQTPYFVNAVEVKGPKNNDYTTVRTDNNYSRLIAQDFNSIEISGPE
jgi:hypothetical protein